MRSSLRLLGLGGTSLLREGQPPPDFRSLLSQKVKPMEGVDRFDGTFTGGSGFLDPSIIANMQQTLNSNLTPEMRDSVQAMLQNAGGLTSGGGMKMGLMAFGMGENEKGKKVARAAKMSLDLQTGKMEKDFVEEQIDPDDVSLPKETVESYETEGAMEVEFVENETGKK